ncbi:acyl carrier protein [Xylanibacter oryzae]|uniref:acyl carrier protein n=1 Tax=Xylanibacter oryzae TaxID=185293 RepID=UPI0004AFFCBE|nr:acyl carrier protein [Xylanibacter oryzae]
MDKKEILEKVTLIFRDILDNDEIELEYNTTSDNIEEWDSLTNVQLIVAIEKYFNIRFTSIEIVSWKNVGELVDNISKKILA